MTKIILPGLAVLFFGSAAALMAQTGAAQAHIRFIFENPKLQPTGYVVDVNEDGSGHFKSEAAKTGPGKTGQTKTEVSDSQSITPQPIDTDIRIDGPLRVLLFKTARSHNFFRVACESMKSRVAFTGKKAFVYTGPDGEGSCTFNWSRDQQIMRISDDLIAVAFTLEEGRRLSVQHEHDRLGLDAELQELQEAATGGRAQELQNIAPQLKAIADDERVMARARQTARQLLGPM